MSTFVFQQCYSIDEIHEQLGGDRVLFLPNVDGKVVCARLKTETNPDAPNIILPGSGPNIVRAAEILEQQPEAVPVFLKRQSNRWQYVGMYRRVRVSCDRADIQVHSKRSCRDDISMVIYMTAIQGTTTG